MNSLTVKILLQKLAITVTVGGLLFSSPTVAQVLSPAEKAARVVRSSDRHDTRGGDRLGLQWNIADIASERLAAGRFDYQRRPIIRLSGEARHRSLGYKNLSINCVYKVV